MVLLAITVAVIALFTVLVIRRKKESPDVPIFTCICNVLLYIPYALKLGPYGNPVSMEATVQRAIKETGLSDFGDKEGKFLQRYETARKLAFQRAHFQYSPVGHVACQTSMTIRLSVQLRFNDYLRKHPEIEKLPMKDPIFIIGFPRTGTTFLHELLGIHPEVRMHYSWEQFDPIPGTDDSSLDTLEADRRRRYSANRGSFDMFLRLAGDRIQSIHRIGYDDSEEDTTPCAMDLPWMISNIAFIAYAAKEVADLGGGQVFKNYRKYLKLMQWQAKDRRNDNFTWMLKCPFHLPYLTELFEEFPQSTIVWTHRDPVDCVGSACSLYETLLLFVMEPSSIDKKILGQAVLEYTKVCLDKAFASIEKAAQSTKILHIRYADNVKDPKGNCRNVCKMTGLPFNEEYEGRLDAYLAKNAASREQLKVKKGKDIHTYSLEEYGLSE